MSTKVVTPPISGPQQSSAEGESVQNARPWEGRKVAYEQKKKEELLAPVRSELANRVKDGLETPLFFRHVFSLENGQGMRMIDPLKINLDFLKNHKNELARSESTDPQLIEELDAMIQELEQALELELIKAAAQSHKKPSLSFKTAGGASLVFRKLGEPSETKPAEPPLKKAAEQIVQAVKNGESRLLPCSLKCDEDGRHAIGIRFSQGKDPETVICSIFNSGAGIRKWHNWATYGEKYDPEYTVRIPKSALTSDLVHALLSDTFELDLTYQNISDLPGAQVLDAEEKAAEGRPVRRQQAQKGGNCSMEWFWAYVKCQIQGENREQNFKLIRTPFMERTFEAAIKNFNKPAPFLGEGAHALNRTDDLDVLRERMIKKMGKVEADKYPNKQYYDSEHYWREFPEVIKKIDQQIINLVESDSFFQAMISQGGYSKQQAWKTLFGKTQFYEWMERKNKFQ